jgi:hypothetical protein
MDRLLYGKASQINLLANSRLSHASRMWLQKGTRRVALCRNMALRR